MKDWVESQRKPPRLLTFMLWVLAAAGVMFLMGGAVLDFGPLFTVGGVCIGFAFGFYLSRQTMLDALKQVHNQGGSDAATEREGRRASKDVRAGNGRLGR